MYRSESDSHLQKCIQERTFQNDGFVGPIDILSRQEAKDVYQKYNEWVSTLPQQQQVSGDLRFKPHLFLPFVNRIVHHPALVRAVQQALQTHDILLWSCDFNIKQPNTRNCFAAHQDSTYAGLSPTSKCLTAWVALSDPVGEQEGCLSFWKGSHKQGQLKHVQDATDTTNMLSRGQNLAEPLNEQERVTVPLRGGQATLHSFYTVHASGPNQSTQPRVGLALRYIAANVIQTGKTRESVTLVSGSLQHDGFDLEPILPLENPTQDDILIGKKAHQEAMKREAANYFDGTDTSGYS